VRYRADLRRLLLGFRGLALLRGWPTGDPTLADAQIEEMRRLALDPAAAEHLAIDDEGLDAAYELWSSTYDDEANGLIEAEEGVVADLLRELPAGLAVDAACGTGRLMRLLADRGHDVVGVDRSPAMLRAARGKGFNAHLLQGDLRSLPLRDGVADLVVCGLALTHVDELDPAIDELARVVRPDGHVIVTEFHPIAVATGGQAQIPRADGSLLLARNLVHWPNEYVNAFVAAGLEVIRLEEPIAEERFLATIRQPSIRAALADAVLGLPLAMIWFLRRRGVR